MRACFLPALALTLLFGAVAARAAGSAPEVQTMLGRVQGARLWDGTAVFRGLAFAKPPVGDLRWRAPEPVAAWTGVRPATTKAASCPQTSYGAWNAVDGARGQEDCLYLDVRTPNPLTGAKLPVMVWIHGGGNRGGSMGDVVLSPLGGKGVVLVAIQYRLAALGFMSHRALSAQTADRTSGNYGLMDQIAALHWVHENIARFGGDPANVTLFGQSAGAQDVGLMMLTDGSRGLFQKAIEESGTADFGVPPRSLAQSEQVGEIVARLAGAPAAATSAQLRALPVSALLAAGEAAKAPGLDDASFIWLQATVDGRVLKHAPADILSAGRQQRVALIIGSNARELDLHGRDVRAAVQRLFGQDAPQALQLYGLDGKAMPAPDPRLGDVRLQIADDVTFRCPAGAVAASQTRAGLPVWRYQYDVTPAKGAVTHSSELASVLGDTLVTPPGASPSFGLSDYWVAFAKTGDPNSQGLAAWPRYTLDQQAYLAFEDQGPQQKTKLRAPLCALLSSF